MNETSLYFNMKNDAFLYTDLEISTHVCHALWSYEHLAL